MRRKVEIEQEFDEPLRDVVAGFVEMGYSSALVAEALDVTRPSLVKFCSKQRIRFSRSPIHHRDIKGRPPRPVNHRGRTQTVREWADEFGLSYEGACRRLRIRPA